MKTSKTVIALAFAVQSMLAQAVPTEVHADDIADLQMLLRFFPDAPSQDPLALYATAHELNASPTAPLLPAIQPFQGLSLVGLTWDSSGVLVNKLRRQTWNSLASAGTADSGERGFSLRPLRSGVRLRLGSRPRVPARAEGDVESQVALSVREFHPAGVLDQDGRAFGDPVDETRVAPALELERNPVPHAKP